MKDQSEQILKRKIKKYFDSLSILVTQVPFEIRRLLLPSYMLLTGFKSYIHIDPTGRIGFEVYRERASRFSIKTRRTKSRIEQEIFGVLGQENLLRFNGIRSELRGGILTCKGFVEKCGYMLPRGVSTLTFSKSGFIGPIEIGEEAEAKIINCGIYWVVRKKRFVKTIPFAWLFGNSSCLSRIEPFIDSESDFYSSLFGRLYEIITRGYDEPVDKGIRLKVLKTYTKLIEKVETELKKQFFTTQADELAFQYTMTKYKFFLHPGAALIESQPILRGKVSRKPDYHIQTRESEHIYVEIEPPFCKPFEKSRLTSRLEGALKQISEWKEILNEQVVKGESIRYIIIIGLLDDLDEEEQEILQTFNETLKDLVVVTWDWILDNIDKIKRGINKIG